MSKLVGASPVPERREGRVRLSVRDPQIEKLLAGLNFDNADIERLRRIGKVLWSQRNTWTIARAARGLFAPQRMIDQNAAARMLKAELATLEGGDA